VSRYSAQGQTRGPKGASFADRGLLNLLRFQAAILREPITERGGAADVLTSGSFVLQRD
jgi:hypothetical protein